MYRTYHKISLFTLLLLFTFVASAQKGISDSVIILKQVEISSGRLEEFGTGQKTESIDSITMHAYSGENLSELLLKNSQIYIKSYGMGALASVSMRGTSAAHTAVLWNGFNLQSPMNGAADIALFPVGFSDKIHIQYGGSGALYGSGAMGGSIHLENQPAFGSGILASIQGNISSFMNLGAQAIFELGTKRSFTSVKGFYHSGRNNFPFINTALALNPEVKQTHAELKQYGVMLGQHFLIRKRQHLSFNLWYQASSREIPPLMTQSVCSAIQNDNLMRGTAEWQSHSDKTSFFIRTAINSEMQHFTDSFPTINSHNDFLSSITEIESRFRFGACHLLNLGINNTFEQIKTTNYSEIAARDRISLFGSYRFKTMNEKFTFSLSLRGEYSGIDFLPPVPSVGLEVKPWKGGIIRAAASRIYRLPTFNDIYWNPGGNINIKPEDGWTEELGISQQFTIKKLSFITDITAYNSNISDWIIWLPSATFWTPQNVMEVRSRGLELSTKTQYSINKWSFSFASRYNYSLSKNFRAKVPEDVSIGKQIIYTPIHSGSANLAISFYGFSLAYNHQYTGIRYVSTDNSSFLPSFNTADVRLAKIVYFRSYSLQITFTVENIYNKTYQAISWMPMPGRFYKVGLRIQFQKPLKIKE